VCDLVYCLDSCVCVLSGDFSGVVKILDACPSISTVDLRCFCVCICIINAVCVFYMVCVCSIC